MKEDVQEHLSLDEIIMGLWWNMSIIMLTRYYFNYVNFNVNYVMS